MSNSSQSLASAASNNGNVRSKTTEESDEMNIDLLGYLGQLSPAILNQLYESPVSCLAVFQELPSLAQNFVLRLLFIEQPIPQALISSWVRSISDYNDAAEILSRLNIWRSCTMQSGLPGRQLNAVYQKNLKTSWLGGGAPRSIFTPMSNDKHQPDIGTLDNYSINKRWDYILNYMAGVKLKDLDESIGEITRKVICEAGLIESEDTQEITITASGFQFLLMDISLQIWFFLRKYLGLVENFGFNFIECLSFVIELNYLTLGKSYSTNDLSDSLQAVLQHLREMGLVYQRKRKDGRFYPTRLMVRLFESVRRNFRSTQSSIDFSPLMPIKNEINVKRQGFIVVETNYRVYAYTESPLQIALLTLFIELHYRFPKFLVGLITRDSVRAAFRNGITAKQITHYLSMHAHPQMFSDKRGTVIPSTIIDQIFLWEQERNRLTFCDGVLYSQFNSQTEYEALRKYAFSLNVILFENPARRYIVVTPTGNDEVKRFWKKFKKERD
ncbi:General transcription factor IIH subunit 4 [Sarcoptes scabiei]|uniref:General transcription factor IIH subunit 4 n=1 Tax=Sarcoptes scabiei TaxID=52283 RepID=A0A834RBV4_SARSC|nr:General transcription factor IIH subunit 4 [Sarcoptes scabiei]